MKSRADVSKLVDKVFNLVHQTRNVAQEEYAHEDHNALANFERLSKELGITREQVLWVYLRKHLDGIVSWIRGFRSQREDVRGRIMDAILYEILLWAMVDDLADRGESFKEPDRLLAMKAAVMIPADEFINQVMPVTKEQFDSIELKTIALTVTITRRNRTTP